LSKQLPVAAPSSPTATRLALVLLTILSLCLAPLICPPSAINGDTSWLIHVVERLMAGGQAYVDVVETNPPMAFLIYWPAVALARMFDLSPEVMVYLFTGTIAVVSFGFTLKIGQQALGLAPLGLTVLGAALVLAFLLIPSRSFTQREHLALMLLAPAMFALAARSTSRAPGLSIAMGAGVLAGLGASIKPHFVLAVAMPALTAAAYRRDWRLLIVPETLVAGLLFISYAAAWFMFYPAFFDLPLFLVQNSYRLYSYRWHEYFNDIPALIFLFSLAASVLLAVLLRRHSSVVTLAAGLAAFALAFVEQGKGFAYHLYPVAALGLVLAAFAIALGTPEREQELPAMRGLLLLTITGMAAAMSALFSYARFPDSNGLRHALLAEKSRPSVIIISFDISVNFPLVRDIGGIWASRLQSIWISNSANHAIKRGMNPAQRARTDEAVAIERRWLAEDISRNKPDLVVFDEQAVFDQMRTGADFREAFDGKYAAGPIAQDGRFLIYRRIGS
jgi:hypothetical protein